ncbi:MAG: class I SAM-dependent methyltransferase [Gemmatimonadaceae bacterium]|nr:class I SAM-dependent methyltransferase [Gemmatimonadaceae bacterium]
MLAYDSIGGSYAARRQPDPRIARALNDALGDARRVVNIGAGTGSYEPPDREIVALEPSRVMIAQRAVGAAPAVQGCAESLPFANASFDAAMAVLTIHHWPELVVGLSECARVARSRVVFLTWDPAAAPFWLVDEYFPEIIAHDRRIFPSLERLAGVLGDMRVSTLPIPADCLDGFLGARWRQPAAYLDAATRSAISSFSRVRDPERGLTRLRSDVESGAWAERHRDLLDLDELDLGYRIVTCSRR